MFTNLDTETLRTFVLGFDLGSFARAAERVGRSQSAISTQLRRLEGQVGQTLVRKAGRGLALTAEGEQLLSYARRMLALNDEALDALRGSDLEGWVRLGVPQDLAEAWLPEVLSNFARSHPRINVEVRAEKTGILVDKTRRGELDMCLAWGPVPGAPYVEAVARIPTVWIGRPGWADTPSARDRPIPLVAFEPPCSFRDPAIAALDRAGFGWRVVFSSPSLSALWAAAAAGLGITMRTRIGLPDHLSALDPRETHLPELPPVTLTLVKEKEHQDGPAELLERILLRVLKDRLDAPLSSHPPSP